MQVVCISSHNPTQPYYMLDAFLVSLGRFGINPVILSEGYGGLGTKPVMLRKWIESGNADEHIIFCDAWDVVFQRDPYLTPILDRLVFNAEKNCFPPADYCADFPDPGTPYRYLNSGFSFGPSELYLQAINAMPQDRLVPDKQLPDGSWLNPNDQEFWQQQFLSGNIPISLDTHAEFCHTLSDVNEDELDFREGLIKDKVVGRIPIAFHLNGSKEKWKPKILEHLNLPM